MRRHPLALTTVAVLLTAAGPARAAQLTAQTDCIAPSYPVQALGTGFTPNAEIDEFFDDAPFVGPFVDSSSESAPDETADASGSFNPFFLSAPTQLPAGELTHDYVLRATERGAGDQSATTVVHVGTLGLVVPTKRLSLGAVVTPHVTGFQQGSGLYAHFALKGVPKATTSLGKVSTDGCVGLTVRTRALPVKHPKPGEWLLQIDDAPTFSRDAPNNVRMQISVGRKGLHFHPVVATHPVPVSR